MNLIFICLIGYITFKVKGVNAPKNRKDFWREQINELDQHLLPQDNEEDSNGQPSHSSFSVAKGPTNEMQGVTRSRNANSWASRGV